MPFKGLENAIFELVTNLKVTNEESSNIVLNESVIFDDFDNDHPRWIELITPYLVLAKSFEIHCWNEETEWINIALQYGELKNNDWKYGKVIEGHVTSEFIQMIIETSKSKDFDYYHKMTPLFNVFLDDIFQSCHYGIENYYAPIEKEK